MKVDFAVPSNSTSLSAPATYLHLPVFHRLPLRCGSQESFALLAFLPTDVDRWEGHSDPTDARLHFGIWSLGEIKGGEVPVVHQRISWTRFGTTFSDGGDEESRVARAKCIWNPARIPPFPPLSVSPIFEVSLKPLNDALRLPFSKDVSLSSLVGVRLLIPYALRDGEDHVEFAYVELALDR